MTAGAASEIRLDPRALSRLLPIHMILDRQGVIGGVGPTLARLRPEDPFVGDRLVDRFEIRRPHGARSAVDLFRSAGARLQLVLADPPRTQFKGHSVLLPDGRLLIDLSFGITVSDAVTLYGLTAADFAPTDLAVEMLYMIEAKSAAMEESRKLNTRLQAAKVTAEQQAYTDALTGARNRRGLDSLVSDLVERGVDFGLMHIDLDRFKAVNDSLGHAAGDHILVHAAALLREETRETDHVIRVGGDEFVVLFPGRTGRKRLRAIAERIIRKLSAPVLFEGRECRISASIGVTSSELYDRPEVDTMLRDSDIALYRSKDEGRGRASFFSPETATRPAEARQRWIA